MKNHINKMTYKSLEEVQELFESSFGWLHCALGRMGKLVAIEAPVSILRSELKSWDTKIGLVRDILSDGRIELNAKGKDGWREMLVEYLGFFGASRETRCHGSGAGEGHGGAGEGVA